MNLDTQSLQPITNFIGTDAEGEDITKKEEYNV